MAIMDPIAVLEEALAEGEKKTSYIPTFFRLGDGQKAYIRPLVNFMLPDRSAGYAQMNVHDRFNRVDPKASIKAVCATMVSGECFYCAQAEAEQKAAGGKKDKETLKAAKQLAASPRFYLPVYVHSIQQFDTKSGKWAPATYTDQDGNEQLVNGLRFLELKRTSTILRDLLDYYKESDQHDITIVDFVIKRTGSGLDTEYSCIANPNGPKPFTKEVEGDFSVAGIQARLYDVIPARMVEDEDSAEDEIDDLDDPFAPSAPVPAVRKAVDFEKRLRQDAQKVVNSNDDAYPEF